MHWPIFLSCTAALPLRNSPPPAIMVLYYILVDHYPTYNPAAM